MYKLTEKKTNTLNLYFNDYQYSYIGVQIRTQFNVIIAKTLVAQHNIFLTLVNLDNYCSI